MLFRITPLLLCVVLLAVPAPAQDKDAPNPIEAEVKANLRT